MGLTRGQGRFVHIIAPEPVRAAWRCQWVTRRRSASGWLVLLAVSIFLIGYRE